jgi:D-amino peptidase
MRVNGELCGEIGLSAGVAGRYGVPVVAVTSDLAGCAEAAGLVPQTHVGVVKEGFGRYMGRLLHPSETSRIIEEAACEGVKNRSAVPPHTFSEPTHIAVEFNRAEEADMGTRLLGGNRVDAYTLEATFPTYQEAHQMVWCLMGMAGQGLQAQN